MKIRKSVSQDLARIMDIYAYARSFMAQHGNPNQWGATNWPPETLIRQGIETLQNTGYQDVTLLSLSTSDYRQLPALCDGLLAYCEPRSIGIALPSLRERRDDIVPLAERFLLRFAEKYHRPLTGISPEAAALLTVVKVR